MMIRGTVKKDRKTKNLINRLEPNDIAVIHHKDLDEVAAIHLVERKVRAVINCDCSISGTFPNQGPKILIEAGIPLYDNVGMDFFLKVKDNDLIVISDNVIYHNQKAICRCSQLLGNEINRLMEQASDNIRDVLHDFIDNTLDYASREKEIILSPADMPVVKVNMKEKHILIVIRGKNYKQDLKTIRSYIEEVNPVMIGVDGGADALLEFGYTPDIIIGDMDSVSDYALSKCRQIIVHAYPDGQAPGLKRIQGMGLDSDIFSYPGTSEDIAMILAYENKAELIVAVGSHTNMIDFLEKGRPGMASTFLVRMKVGYKVIDAKGVSELYRNKLKPSYLAAMFLSALFPIAMIAKMSPMIQEWYHLVALRLKILIGL
ncbi:MAG: putative cytokinetic ring protein SteA [Clostridia bacterium]|nr:putative cytokinetic ring protein SteA [Clostridia bacterium]